MREGKGAGGNYYINHNDSPALLTSHHPQTHHHTNNRLHQLPNPTPTTATMAFVAATPVLARSAPVLKSTSFTSRRAVAPVRRQATLVMANKEKIPQGFTSFSEQLNGRAAMFGFVLAVVTEAITGKGILGQLAALGDVSSIASALGLH